MKVINFPEKFKLKESVLILGGFSFIHNGHLKLIKKAQTFNLPIVIMTLHNFHIFFKHKNYLQSLKARLQNLANLKIDYTIVVNFTKEIMMMPGQKFLKKMQKICNPQYIIAGQNFSFGKNRDLSIEKIPSSIIVENMKNNNQKISTQFLNEIIELEDVDLIKKMAPFPYWDYFKLNLKNDVLTSNLKIAMHPGIYAVYAIFKNMKYWGYLHIDFFTKKPKVFIPDFKNFSKDQIIEIAIEFHKCVKKIIREEENIIQEEDIHQVQIFLKNC